MKCQYCNGTGKYKKPKNQEKFDYWYDHFMDMADFCSPSMAEKKAYDKVGYDLVVCPYCKKDN